MKEKVALFAFNGEPICFVHVLLNALDLNRKGHDVRLIIEGSATRQIQELLDQKKPFAKLYTEAKEADLIDCVCQACAKKMGTFESAKDQELPICDDMSGHPSISRYMEEGYTILTF